MSDGGCEISIDVPQWVPAAIAFGLSVVIAIGVCIAYVAREIERHKTFYGREDKLSSREESTDAKKKEEMDAYALGRCSHEVLVINSPPQATPGAVPGTAPTGVKVMLRKRRVITKTPIKQTALSLPTSLEPATPNVLSIAVVYDKTGRAFELIDLLRNETPMPGSRSKKVDWLLHQIKTRLETMTDRHYIVYGSIEDQIWIVKGLENLRENVEETHLEMRLNVDALDLKILAYKIQAISAEQAMLMSRRGRTSDVLRPEPTQVTPSRWMVLRGSTPEATPHKTPGPPQSRKRSAEATEQDRRSKEALFHVAKTLRKSLRSSPSTNVAHSISSHPKTLSAGTALAHSKDKDAKERLLKARALVDSSPTRKSIPDIKESTDQHGSSDYHGSPRLAEFQHEDGVIKQDENKLSEAVTQTTLRKSAESKENHGRPKQGASSMITF